jgi:hypothetical protein
MTDTKNDITHVEDLEEAGIAPPKGKVMGTVKLTDGLIVYIPTPTADPQDPLNMPLWQKWIVLVVISICQSAWIVSAVVLADKSQFPRSVSRS